VIDLGPVQLQVAEACSGIRYLFPLTSLALLCAYLYRDRLWKRVVLVVSALPVSIFINGLRIGIVGVLVEFYGPQAAEGFLHLFEGWVLFLATLGLLVLEMWVLSKIQALPGSKGLLNGSHGKSFRNRRGVRPRSRQASYTGMQPKVPAYVGSLALILPVAVLSPSIGERTGDHSRSFGVYGFFHAHRRVAGQSTAGGASTHFALRFDDYLLADYAAPGGGPLTLYMAYYQSQRKGQSAHSPQSCIPGGGWEITSKEP
jgi:exosortase/archaeosortase family protein